MDKTPFDFPFIINSIFLAAIGSFFGSIIGVWLTNFYQRKRDDLAWQREKEKLESKFAHENGMIEKQFSQRITELEIKIKKQEEENLKEKLIQGIDEPERVIRKLHAFSTIQKSGEKAPVSGHYEIIGPKGEKYGREVTVVKGEPLPPTPKPGQGYILIKPNKLKNNKNK